ncbi:MAG: type II toxin-antitoxin system HipA family toxin [Humidesulfovibrio sp.]|nr:type II toxin-antitoxin system HipA family toxin [Humidesulfovibrio sp.]
MIEVRAGKILSGRLTRTEQQRFAFTYLPDVSAEASVSLTMPVRSESWIFAWGLHPIFQMNLPEGALRLHLENLLAKAVPDFDDLELLRVTGHSHIGRLSYGTPGSEIDALPAAVSVQEILTYDGAEDLFRDLLERFALYSGVSGVQPKVLVRATEGLKLSPDHKVTLQAATHIVKTWDERYPELALNEHFCLLAAKHSGLTVPSWSVSENGRFLVVDRFDLDEQGQYLGLEDFCVLQGLGTKDKYSGSYEQLAKIIKAFVPSEGQNKALRAFFKMVALSVGLRNGDAHRKNFCVLYDSPVLRQGQLAPTFDQITTTAYLPHDSMALLLRGSKRWPSRADLQDFATKACALSPHEAEVDLGEVESGIVLARADLQDRVQAGDAFADVGARMLNAWSEGLLAITG